MPLIISPRQLQRRAELYHQLAILLAAGLTLPLALEQLKNNPPSPALRPQISLWQEFLAQGASVTDSLRRLGSWIPSFDLALVEAGEQSGRLDASFKMLAFHYEERVRLVKQAMSDLMYPMFILHMAVVLFPFISLITTGNWIRFVFTILAVLIPFYGAAFFLVLACQGRHGENWRAGLERVLRPLPLLGNARRDLALSRLAAALEALLNAGVSIVAGWELAAAASGSPALRRLVLTWRPRLDEGRTPSELVAESKLFPSVFHNLYHTGEISGQLDQTLHRLHVLYEEEGLRRMRLAAQWGPRLVYFAVLIYCACRIISFYMGYFQQIQDIKM